MSVVGALVGALVGDLVGALVGDLVGALVVGAVVGGAVGALVTPAAVGDRVGLRVGERVGARVVGARVGERVVGASVGERVVGASVGASVTATPQSAPMKPVLHVQTPALQVPRPLQLFGQRTSTLPMGHIMLGSGQVTTPVKPVKLSVPPTVHCFSTPPTVTKTTGWPPTSAHRTG